MRKKVIEAFGVNFYSKLYMEEKLTNDSIQRIFQNREEMNLVCLLEGSMAGKAGGITEEIEKV